MLPGSYSYGWVALSIAFALFVAYAALAPVGRRSVTRTLSWIARWWRKGLESAPNFPSRSWRTQFPPSCGRRADGAIDFVSDKLYRYTGFKREPAMDWGWTDAIKPDDLAVCRSKWEHALRVGEPLRSNTVYAEPMEAIAGSS
jgi:hypothetical protein